MKPKAIIFDMDGVLIDSEPLWNRETIKILHEIECLDIDKFEYPSGVPAEQIAEMFLTKYPHLNISVKDLGIKINTAAIDAILTENPIFPGVIDLLEYLSSLGIKLGIASASPLHMLETIVHNCKIEKYFSVLSSAMTLSHNKPHPVVYLNALEQLGINYLDAVGIEDSIIGMTAVKAANMKCIVVPYKNCNDPRWTLADYKLKNITEVKNLITYL